MAPPVGREAIWSKFFALFNPSLLQANGGPFAVVSRRAIPYTQASAKPALYLLQRHETAIARERGTPTKWELRAEIYVYADNPVAGDIGGGQVLNPLIDAVESAMAPLPVQGNVQSLGGIVSRAFIEGEVQVYEGNIDGQSVAIIPVCIVTPV